MKGRRHAYLTLGILYDSIGAATAWMLAYTIRFPARVIPMGAYPMPPWTEFALVLPPVVLMVVAVLVVAGMYRPGRTWTVPQEMLQVVKVSIAAWLGTLAFLYYYRRNRYSLGVVTLFLFLNPVALWIARRLLARTLRSLTLQNWWVQDAAIIGAGRLGQRVSLWLLRHREMGVRVSYFVDDSPNRIGKPLRGIPVHGPLNELDSITTKHPVPIVFVALSIHQTAQLNPVLQVLACVPAAVYILPDLAALGPADFHVSTLDDLPMVHVRESRMQGWPSMFKRAVDLSGASTLLALFALPMIIVAITIKLTSTGPVLFRQRRMGLGTAPFTMLKFRTMRENAEATTGQVWARENDPRCTTVGRILRRTSLDELPQLFNVLKGEMSLVGPRPEMTDLTEDWKRLLPRYLLRTQVKAGMTGWAQIHGLRGNTSLRKRLQYDLYYINHWSPLLDLYILILTPFLGFVNRNAY